MLLVRNKQRKEFKYIKYNLHHACDQQRGLYAQAYFSPVPTDFLHFWGILCIQFPFQIILKPPAPFKTFSDTDVALKYLFKSVGANVVQICRRH